MDTPYLYSTERRQRSSSYIPVNHTYYHQLNELNHSVWVRGPGLLQQWDISAVLGFFMGRFGGDLEEYTAHRCNDRSFLVRLPNHLNREMVIESLRNWAWRGNLTLQPWLQGESLNRRPISHRVKIRIEDFPFPVWNRGYIIKYLQDLGEIEELEDRSHCRDYIEAWIRCQDPNEIPRIGTVHYDQFWGECRISIVEEGGEPPPPAPRNMGTAIATGLEEQQSGTGESTVRLTEVTQRANNAQLGNFSTSGDSTDPSWYVETEQAQPCVPCKPHEPGLGKGGQRLQEEGINKVHAKAGMIKFGTLLPIQVSIAFTEPNMKGEKGVVWGGKVALQDPKWGARVRIRVGTVLIYADQGKGQEMGLLKGPAYESMKESKKGLNPCQTGLKGNSLFEERKIHCLNNLQGPPLNPKTITKGPCKTILSTLKQNNASLLGPIPKQNLPGVKMTSNTDELASMFAALQAGNELALVGVDLPLQGVTERDWELAVVAKVVSDRQVYEAQFIQTMVKAWGAHPETKFTLVGRNTYLIDFFSEGEKTLVMNRELWLYRGDIIVMRRAREQADLSADFITTVDLWTQLHHIPPESVNKEGVYHLAETIGKPVSDARQTSQNGKIFWRIRLSLPINESLKGTKTMNHPTLGPLLVYLVYERTGRVCEYCGCLGHEISSCPKYGKVLSMAGDPFYTNRPELEGLLEFRWGPWVTAASLVPRNDGGKGPQKRGSVPPGFEPEPGLQGGAQADSELGGDRQRQKSHADQGKRAAQLERQEESGKEGDKARKVYSNRVRPRNNSGTKPVSTLMITEGLGRDEEMGTGDGSGTSAKRLRAASPKSPPRAQ